MRVTQQAAAGKQEGDIGTAAEAIDDGGTRVRRRAAGVPLVLILIRDVTEMVQAHEQASRVADQPCAESQAAQAGMHTELEATSQRLRNENARLKAELDRQSGINRTLLESNQKLAEGNLVLHAANEDLQLSEEKAEASSEEVKTINEELQAANEELVTANDELEATVEELHAVNDELQARTRAVQELGATLEMQETQHPDQPK